MAKTDQKPAGDEKPAGITDETRPMAELRADPANARRHSQAQIATIAHSIDEFGFVNRVIIRADGTIIGGHATVEALKRLGREQVDCRVVRGLTETQYSKLALALNRIPENSSWDDDALRDVLTGIHDAGDSVLDIGFSATETDRLLKAPEEIAVEEIETGPVDDECWISIRGPLAHQADMLAALEQAMKPYKGVTVELGTINMG